MLQLLKDLHCVALVEKQISDDKINGSVLINDPGPLRFRSGARQLLA
jgi:hypothetical protein